MNADLDELRARIQTIAAKRPTQQAPLVEPRRPRPKLAWSGAQSGHMVSAHDHWGFMRRTEGEQWCDKEAGGCGQEWVLLVGGDRPPKLYARPYRGDWPARPYGANARDGG